MKEYSIGIEIKNLLKMIKLTRQWKQNVVCGVLFLALGVLFICIGGFNTFLGGLYFMISGGTIMSGLEQVFYSSYANTSPKHKFYCTVVYPLLYAFAFIVGYLIAALTIGIKILLIRQINGSVFGNILSNMNMGISSGTTLVIIGIMGMLFYIYFGISSKNYIVVSLIFIVVFWFIYLSMIFPPEDANDLQIKMSFGSGFVIGFLILLLGIAIGVMFRNALYKKPYSPMYKKAFLRLSKM
jgi:hypothetical protein